MFWWGHMLKPPDGRNRQNAVYAWAERDPGAFTYCARKTTITKGRKICRDRSFTSKCCLTPSSSEQKKPVTSCSTSLVTLTWSQSHLQKKKRKKYQLSCIYLLDKCKGFLPFHVWILWKQNPFFFFFYFQSTYCSVLVVWMDAWLNRVTFPVYVKKESVPVCVQWVCRLVSLKQYEW